MTPVYKTESFILHAAEIGQDFQIEVSLPDAYESQPETAWEVAYVTDGNLAFNLASTVNSLCGRDILDPAMRAAIVVGIGYPDPADLSLLRVRELTPQGSVDDWFANVYVALAGKPAESGGAAKFLAFIEGQLHEEICRRYRVRNDAAALFGDSYGGLFTFYAMLQPASLFDRFWIGSPGVFGAGNYLLDQLPARLDAGFSRPTRVALTLGGEERHASVGGVLQEEIYQQIAVSYDRILADLQNASDANFAFAAREFEGETHTSVFAPSFSFAWRYLMHPATMAG